MIKLHAIQYARRDGLRRDHFVDDDAHPDEPHPTAYYVWLATSPGRTVLIDTGMRPDTEERVPGLHRGPAITDTLRALGVAPESIGTVVLTHLHYDHAGGVREFSNADYVLQASEVDNVADSWLVDRSDVDYLLGSRRLTLVDGEQDIAPGMSVHHVGGHTRGMQVVRVRTAQGQAVVASDATHFYENIESRRPSPILDSRHDAIRAFARITELADEPDLILPGHDPAVLARLPPPTPRLAGHVGVLGSTAEKMIGSRRNQAR